MLPPIPTLRIVQIDEGSPTLKPNDLPGEPLVPPPLAFTITETVQQIISDLKEPPRDKRKKIATELDSPMKTLKKSEGWSQEEIGQALEEIIRIQALKDNLNSMLGISPLF